MRTRKWWDEPNNVIEWLFIKQHGLTAISVCGLSGETVLYGIDYELSDLFPISHQPADGIAETRLFQRLTRYGDYVVIVADVEDFAEL